VEQVQVTTYPSASKPAGGTSAKRSAHTSVNDLANANHPAAARL